MRKRQRTFDASHLTPEEQKRLLPMIVETMSPASSFQKRRIIERLAEKYGGKWSYFPGAWVEVATGRTVVSRYEDDARETVYVWEDTKERAL